MRYAKTPNIIDESDIYYSLFSIIVFANLLIIDLDMYMRSTGYNSVSP